MRVERSKHPRGPPHTLEWEYVRMNANVCFIVSFNKQLFQMVKYIKSPIYDEKWFVVVWHLSVLGDEEAVMERER